MRPLVWAVTHWCSIARTMPRAKHLKHLGVDILLLFAFLVSGSNFVAEKNVEGHNDEGNTQRI